MGKKNKLGIGNVIERVEQLVNDALKRIDTLQNQVHDLREQMMERVGFADKSSPGNKTSAGSGTKSGGSASSKAAKSSASKTAKSAPATAKSGNAAKSGSASKSGNTGKSSGAAKKSGTAQKSSGAKKDDLTRINGIGPATAKKMQAKGITSISQLANPSADDKKKLEEFSKLKSFSSWQSEAKKLV